MRKIIKALTLVIGIAVGPAMAVANEVVIGVSAALSGSAAGTYAAPAEGLKLYIERLNDAGGGQAVSVLFYGIFLSA